MSRPGRLNAMVRFEREHILGTVSGETRERRARALELAEHALAAVDPEAATERALARLGSLDGATLFAFGKAALPMTRAATRAARLAGGIVVAPADAVECSGRLAPSSPLEGGVLERPGITSSASEQASSTTKVLDSVPIRVCVGGHPDPAADAVETGRAFLERATALGEGEVALCLVSGGGSALLELPAGAVTLRELTELTRALRERGASIDELNAVRRRLSQLKGGGLARAIAPAAIRNVILSDVAPLPPSVVASGPSCAPPEGPDAAAVLERYGLTPPPSVVAQLRLPPPLSPALDIRSELAADNHTARAAVTGRDGSITDRPGTFDGDARTLGARLAAEVGGSPWVWGGETTVEVRGDGVGGRNQEVALGALAAGWKRGLLLCLGTDGIDGASDAAGALIDEAVANDVRRRGLDPTAALDANDATPFFDAVGTSLRCGPTGTNVADLCLYLP